MSSKMLWSSHMLEIRLDVNIKLLFCPSCEYSWLSYLRLCVRFRITPDFAETLGVRHTSQGCHSVVVVNLIVLLPSALHQRSTVTLQDRQTLSATNLIMKIGEISLRTKCPYIDAAWRLEFNFDKLLLSYFVSSRAGIGCFKNMFVRALSIVTAHVLNFGHFSCLVLKLNGSLSRLLSTIIWFSGVFMLRDFFCFTRHTVIFNYSNLEEDDQVSTFSHQSISEVEIVIMSEVNGWHMTMSGTSGTYVVRWQNDHSLTTIVSFLCGENWHRG